MQESTLDGDQGVLKKPAAGMVADMDVEFNSSAFEALERDFQEVLSELVGDKSLERFRWIFYPRNTDDVVSVSAFRSRLLEELLRLLMRNGARDGKTMYHG